MKAIILLGGQGTRLRPLTLAQPKPLVPILNRPFISYQLDLLKKFGLKDVVLALGHQAQSFRHALGSGKKFGMRFIYSLEKTPLGTGGALRLAFKHVDGPCLVLNGDLLAQIDLQRLVRFHQGRQALGTLLLATVEDPSSYGLVETGPEGRIKTFLEKPSLDQLTTKTINGGCYVFEPSLLRSIPEGRSVSLEREVFPLLLSQGAALYGYAHAGYWRDIGTLSSYWAAHRDLLEPGRTSFYAGPKLKSSLSVGPGCRIAPGVVFRGFNVLGAKCVVEQGVTLSHSVLHGGVKVGEGARLDQCVIGAGSVVGAQAQLGPAFVLGPNSTVESYSRSF